MGKGLRIQNVLQINITWGKSEGKGLYILNYLQINLIWGNGEGKGFCIQNSKVTVENWI